MKSKTLPPAALKPDDLLEVLTGLWERVVSTPEVDIDGILVQTERTQLVIAPGAKCSVRRKM